jgi:hypothetical protein
MKTRDLRIRTWALLGLLSGVLPGMAWAAADVTESRAETISVTADRPLYAFSLELNKRHPVAVTYEEPAPAAENAGKRATPGALVVRYQVAAATGMPEDVAGLLEDAIAAHDTAGGDVRFKMNENDGTYHIVPAAVRNARGRWVKIVPLLDTPVTLAAQEWQADDVLLAIRDALQREAGAKVLLAEVPINWASRTKVQLSGQQESARELLDEALAGGRFTWQLLYDRKLKAYVLRIQPLAAVEPGQRK